MNELKLCQKYLKPFGVEFDIAEVQCANRAADLVFVRALIVVILRAKGYSLHATGRILNRDHASINHLEKHYENQPQEDHSRFKQIKAILQQQFESKSLGEQIKWHQDQMKRLIRELNERNKEMGLKL